MLKNNKSLDKKKIQKKLSKKNLHSLIRIEVKKTTGSTNEDAKNYLTNHKRQKLHLAIFSEQQTSGRGRENKKWVSPYGKNIYFSLAWNTDLKHHELEGLSLATAVVISNCLKEVIPEEIQIKWPNDLFISEKKVGGILIETVTLERGLTGVVIGVGLNILMTKEEGKNIDQDWTSLKGSKVDRNEISGLILEAIMNLTKNFRKEGFIFYKPFFEKLNFLQNKTCRVQTKNTVLQGTIKGINKKGELILEDKSNIHNLRYGEVNIVSRK